MTCNPIQNVRGMARSVVPSGSRPANELAQQRLDVVAPSSATNLKRRPGFAFLRSDRRGPPGRCAAARDFRPAAWIASGGASPEARGFHSRPSCSRSRTARAGPTKAAVSPFSSNEQARRALEIALPMFVAGTIGQGGVKHPPTCGCFFSHSASFSALSSCCLRRTAIVLRPRDPSHASSGETLSPRSQLTSWSLSYRSQSPWPSRA